MRTFCNVTIWAEIKEWLEEVKRKENLTSISETLNHIKGRYNGDGK